MLEICWAIDVEISICVQDASMYPYVITDWFQYDATANEKK
jgi:hypothetical protein